MGKSGRRIRALVLALVLALSTTAPALAEHETITITCANGAQLTVDARAEAGITRGNDLYNQTPAGQQNPCELG
jgi:hypothetical protein